MVITIDYKQYGVQLNFTPVVLGDGRIRLQLNPEVSELDPSNGVTLNGFVIPAITQRSMSSTIELNDGQTLAMGGLLQNRINATASSTPLLGDLPVIGPLFRSVRFQRNDTELVVLVTPHLVSAMNPAQVSRKCPANTGAIRRKPICSGIAIWAARSRRPVSAPRPIPSTAGSVAFTEPSGSRPRLSKETDPVRIVPRPPRQRRIVRS